MITLERFCYSDFGTFGTITLPDGQQLATVERPWLDNKPRVSCIPNGQYRCEPRRYYKGGYNAVEVKDVPNRTYILFHRGNFVRNSQGCILINTSHGAINDEWCGKGSRAAFDVFMQQLGRREFTLTITDRKGAELWTSLKN